MTEYFDLIDHEPEWGNNSNDKAFARGEGTGLSWEPICCQIKKLEGGL